MDTSLWAWKRPLVKRMCCITKTQLEVGGSPAHDPPVAEIKKFAEALKFHYIKAHWIWTQQISQSQMLKVVINWYTVQ